MTGIMAATGHYGSGDGEHAGLDGLDGGGLARLREFHVRGAEATAGLMAALQAVSALQAGQRVLDVGSGIGSPACHIAAATGCRVTGIDLTAAYVRAAGRLAAHHGVAGQASFTTANALALPFADGHFDHAYTQHVAMNIADKPALYAELRRVVAPGGCLGIYDLLQGAGGPVHFPAPWARSADASFLAAPDTLRHVLESAGWEIVDWQDLSEEARVWQAAQRGENGPTLLEVLFGELGRTMGRNQRRNLEEGRVIPTQVICRRG